MKGESLIFIFSTPRSGSTLLQRLLATNEEIHTDVESWFLLHPIYATRQAGISAEYGHYGARQALIHYLSGFEEGQDAFYDAVRRYACCLYNTALHNTGKKYFLDKSPPYTRVIKEIGVLFPEAKFVILTRNPLANLYSVLTTWTKGKWEKLYWSRYDLLEGPADLVDGRAALNGNCIEVSYENLVDNPCFQLNRIADYLGLERSGFSLRYDVPDRPKTTNARLFVGDPDNIENYTSVTSEARDKWLALADRSQTLHYAYEYMDALGSELVNKLGYSKEALTAQLDERARNRSVQVASALVPWDLAMTPEDERSRSDRLRLRRLVFQQDYGRVRGFLKYLRQFGFEIVKSALMDGKKATENPTDIDS